MSDHLAVQQIFVYGTLMSRFDNPMSFLLESNCQLVGKGIIKGRLYDAGDFPAAVYDEQSEETIKGEIHLIHPEKFNKVIHLLDQYEGFSEGNEAASLYVRNVLPVQSEDGHSVPCWAYIYNQSTAKMQLISEGNYIKHLKDQGRNLY